MTTTYDAKCYDLAVQWLDDIDLTPTIKAKHAHELAQRIQQTIEDYLEEEPGHDR